MSAPSIRRFRVDDGKDFRLERFDPRDTADLASKAEAERKLAKLTARLEELQGMLYAQRTWSLLLVFQAMDAAGKDSTVKHVLAGVNPQGCQVRSFKQPSDEELDHDFLWRCSKHLPERGRIGIFNRSHYEEVLVVRVHPEILKNERLPADLVGKSVWKERLESIADFERHLARNGTAVLKFFLNVSLDEQKKRFLERLDEPEKNWKFSARDVDERPYWDAYMQAYEDAIRATAAPHAPWYVVPADKKWATRAVVSAAIVEELERLHLAYPKLDAARKKGLDAARRKLLAEG